jgi:hypothetical protein
MYKAISLSSLIILHSTHHISCQRFRLRRAISLSSVAHACHQLCTCNVTLMQRFLLLGEGMLSSLAMILNLVESSSDGVKETNTDMSV